MANTVSFCPHEWAPLIESPYLQQASRPTDNCQLQARSEELRSRTQRTTPHFGKRRMLRAFPKLKHGAQNRSLDTLREQLKRK